MPNERMVSADREFQSRSDVILASVTTPVVVNGPWDVGVFSAAKSAARATDCGWPKLQPHWLG